MNCGHYRSQLGFCVTATGDRSQPMVELQTLSRKGVFKGGHGRPLSHVYPSPYASFQLTSGPDSTCQNLLFIELGRVVAKRVWVSVSIAYRYTSPEVIKGYEYH